MKRSNAQLLTSLVLPTLLVASFGIFMTALVQRIGDDQRLRSADDVSLNAAEHLKTRFETSVATLRGIAAFWIGSQEVKPEEFERYAKTVFQPDGPIVALEWVDTGNVVRMVYPREGDNLKAIDLDNNKFPNRLTPILTAKQLRTPVMTGPILLAQGFPGVVIYQPIYRDDEYLGMAVGVVRLSTLFREFSGTTPFKGYGILIVSGDAVLRTDGAVIFKYGRKVVAPSGETEPDASAPSIPTGVMHGVATTDVEGQPWTIFVASKSGGLTPVAAAIALVTLAVALLCGFFLATLYDVRSTLETTVTREHDFAALVSHQLRAPLTELNWMVDVVDDPQTPADERASTLADMRRIVRQGVRTIGGLLTLSRIERGILEIKKEETSVATLVEDALSTLREAAKERRTTFHIDVPPQLTALVDASKAVDALRNVIENAIKYGPEGGAIDIGALKADGSVRVMVRDRGQGIPKEIGQTVFDKASAFAKKGTTEGAGLGLYISKMLLELMGGTIAFNTGSGGTTFVLTLPAEDGAKPKKA
ncbi:MAG TPA: ATP-binding protein [Candidatus Binatia bacterium]|jgi:sensor domain CHASE-containing protein/anti-sigma regulatory factor (Ser/Thr protein kinase)|nr:ATP-binding protein [Candidatus Binatia bacterium]